MPRALVVAQAFPPLLKNAGGVAKRYLTLCRALIDGLGWEVVLVSPVEVAASGEADVSRWLESGQMRHVATAAKRVIGEDGEVFFLDVFSVFNTCCLLKALLSGCDICITDDVPFRLVLFLLVRGLGLPSVTTTHTDATRLRSYRGLMAKLVWRIHLASAHVVTIHASVSRVFAEIMRANYWVPVQAVWPPILWAQAFHEPVEAFASRAAALRAAWVQALAFEPKAILLFAGRWSSEKRIHLLARVVPEGCALVIVGDSTAEYADTVEDLRSRSVLPLRRMLDAEELRTAYAAADLFVSASDFETLGNVVVEAFCSGTPVAVQPAQGHLEFVRDRQNSYFVDFDYPEAARRKLTEIVASGIRPPVEPALSQLGQKFRSQDFPQAMQEALLAPALAKAASWRRCWRLVLVEPLLRLACLTAWLWLWVVVGVVTRIFYLVSCNPRFRSVSKAGGAVEPASVRVSNQQQPQVVQAVGCPQAKEAWGPAKGQHCFDEECPHQSLDAMEVVEVD